MGEFLEIEQKFAQKTPSFGRILRNWTEICKKKLLVLGEFLEIEQKFAKKKLPVLGEFLEIEQKFAQNYQF